LRKIEENWDEIRNHTNITKDKFTRMITFCVKECAIISFENNIYEQVFGLQMGSSLAPIIADLVLRKLFDECIPKFPTQPLFIKKYVDDIICAIPRQDVEVVQNILNNYDEHIQFTSETETNNEINFLDLTLMRQNKRILTNWYQKETSSGRIFYYTSAHPYKMKFNVALSFARRVITLSDRIFFQTNCDKISQILQLNNYPGKLINSIIHRIKNDHHIDSSSNNNSRTNENVNTTIKYVSLNYVPNFSQKIANKLSSQNCDITIGFKPMKTIKDNLYTRVKDKEDKNDKAGVVYSIPCGVCEKVYVGETGQKLITRKKQHMNDLKNAYTQPPRTSMIQHTLDTAHKFNYEKMDILDYENNRTKRQMLEASYIMCLSPHTVNKKTDSNAISEKYLSVINEFASHSKISPKKKLLNKN